MTTAKAIYQAIDKIAPFNTALPWDNCGLLLGDADHAVNRCVVALDITKETIDYAREVGAELIVTHHPVIFSPLKKLSFHSIQAALIGANIAVISAHTNLDLSPQGTNAALFLALGLLNMQAFHNEDGIGLIGTLQTPLYAKQFAEQIKSALHSPCVSYTDSSKIIRTVALCSGAGGDFIEDAVCQADAFLTGELKHHEFLLAADMDFPVFAAGHGATEAVFVQPMCDYLKNAVAGISTFPFEKEKISAI